MQGTWSVKGILVHIGAMTGTGCARTREPQTDSYRRITSRTEMQEQVNGLPETAVILELGNLSNSS